jgi:hypothetical protein
MANISRNFLAGKMNKDLDERVIPNGQYTNAMNVRIASTEGNFGNDGNGSIGVVENARGNEPLTRLAYIDGSKGLSTSAKCIGAYEDGSTETIYWFVHDSNFNTVDYGITKLDLIVSYSEKNQLLDYHIFSINHFTDKTVLNFNPDYLITGVNLIENLLFFTDDYNPPRVININKNYANPIDYIDAITEEEILVIKKPPVAAPIVTPTKVANESNYLETRFVCFAYRYKYEDGQYSATSQWSDISFIPNQFEFSINSFLNEGMVNSFNSALIQYNSGGPLVVGIDLLFKQSNNNIIKVIEKLNKKDLGLLDNTVYAYTFSNSKIFTILPEAELLRLYDNVPLLANSQTIMGNRIMYGNYVEGYDLVDALNQPIRLGYVANLVSEDISVESLNLSTSSGNYYLVPNVPNSVLNIDLSGIDLTEGSSLTVSFRAVHQLYYGSPSTGLPISNAGDIDASFTFILPASYNSVYEMATSTEFVNFIGTGDIYGGGNIQHDMANSCNGVTFTDQFNCSVQSSLSSASTSYNKLHSFIQPSFQSNLPIAIITTPASSILSLQITATLYIQDPPPPSGLPQEFRDYYEITNRDAQWQKIATPKSLHSNRGYEIGIVYMDEYNRASTTLVSKNNNVNVPCGYSSFRNSIQVTIPTTQIAPYWAKRYKFVIKPDLENYETIYSNLCFTNKNLLSETFFLLEGENARKVQVGDRYIVKRDNGGPLSNCAYATVLDKQTYAAGFIETVTGATPPAGVYMKINASSFDASEKENSVIDYGQISNKQESGGSCAVFSYPMSYPNTDIDYTVPAGSKIIFDIRFYRKGAANGCACERRNYTLNKTFTALSNYDNMEDWFIGDNIAQFLNDGIKDVSCGQCLMDNIFQTGYGNPSCDLCTNYYRFDRDGNGRLYFKGSGTVSCPGTLDRKKSFAYATITVYRTDNLFVFETEPTDALPDVFFENELCFDIVDGYHMGNVINQTSTQIGIVDTGFFNCFSFGNGVESYKVRDSIVGRPFNLGQRVTSVSAEDYKRAHRFADITYSGVFNTESNVNKLNEFNLGLLNWKRLESSFGSIQILDGRETDVLVLQEDKISYVLSGKNLLSDSAAGGAITSVPEVLGTQIARTEKYGISSNPESYVQWGYDRYFTDTKRGAVIQLKGNAFSNEQLKVVSDESMSVFFRDTFKNSIDRQKLGGYDPFTNEYVLSINNILKPSPEKCQECGITFTLPISSVIGKSFCVNLGTNIVGSYTVSYSIPSVGEEFNVVINSIYNGIESSSDPIYDESGEWSFDKTIPTESTAYISFDFEGAFNSNQNITITIGCPEVNLMSVIQVVLTDNGDAGDTIHAEYFYTQYVPTSPLQSTAVTFASSTAQPLVSLYNSVTGAMGNGAIPVLNSDVYIRTNKTSLDTFDFSIGQNRLMYLYTDTQYPNLPNDINSLVFSATPLTVSPVSGGEIYSGNFNMGSTYKDYLYLIYDLRTLYELEGCYSAESAFDAYCFCEGEAVIFIGYMDSPDFLTATTIYYDENRYDFALNGYYVSNGIIREMVNGVLLPSEVPPACPTLISLCYSEDNSNDACCSCPVE